jgi:hypothetical protein
MTTLTLTLDDAAALKAQQVAQRRHTSLEDMVRGYVMSLSNEEMEDEISSQRESAWRKLAATFRDLSRPLGGKGYSSRDELYER